MYEVHIVPLRILRFLRNRRKPLRICLRHRDRSAVMVQYVRSAYCTM